SHDLFQCLGVTSWRGRRREWPVRVATGRKYRPWYSAEGNLPNLFPLFARELQEFNYLGVAERHWSLRLPIELLEPFGLLGAQDTLHSLLVLVEHLLDALSMLIGSQFLDLVKYLSALFP